MAVRNLTDRYLQSIKPTDRRQEIPDGDTKGLYLVVQPSGTMAWAYRYRRGGKPTKLTIGNYPALSLADARKAVRAHRAALDQALDPKAIQAAEKARVRREERPGDDSVASWFDRYLVVFEGRKRNRSLSEVKRRGIDIKAAFGKMHVTMVTTVDVQEMVISVAKSGKIKANRTYETCRAFFNWAIKNSGIKELTHNPCSGIGEGVLEEEQSRDRVLTWEEFATLWSEADALDSPFGKAIKVLMLTGQRRDEVGEMPWSELNRGMTDWTIPATRTKNGKEHVVPIPDGAAAIIAAIHGTKAKGEFVFSTTEGKSPISGWGKVKLRLDAKCGFEKPWRVHDLRRTFATGLAEIGVPQNVTEALLNHKSKEKAGIAGVYNKYQYTDEMRIAIGSWQRFVNVVNDPVLLAGYREMKNKTLFKTRINGDSVAWERELEDLRKLAPVMIDDSDCDGSFK